MGSRVEQTLREGLAERLWILCGSAQRVAEGEVGRVGAGEGLQVQPGLAVTHRQGPDRCGASGLERCEQRPLGVSRGPRRRVVDLAQHGDDIAAVRRAFDGERALPGGRQHDVGREQLCDRAAEIEPAQTGGGEQDRVEVALLHGAQPGLDIAAQRDDVQIRAADPQLGDPSR